jgi:hypothetical protein
MANTNAIRQVSAYQELTLGGVRARVRCNPIMFRGRKVQRLSSDTIIKSRWEMQCAVMAHVHAFMSRLKYMPSF